MVDRLYLSPLPCLTDLVVQWAAPEFLMLE
jgi:hypothetical protein